MCFSKHIGLFALLFFATVAQAQQKEAAIIILTKPKQDGVWIRWAPASTLYWQLGNKYGYTIERFTLTDNGDMVENATINLTPEPIKPYGEAQMASFSENSDEIAVIEELLYGERAKDSFRPDDISTVLKRNNELENSYGMAMLMCDISIDAAKAAGLFFKDDKAQMGKRYIYRIKIAHQPSNFTIEPGVVVVNAKEEQALMQFTDVGADFGDKTVTLSWSTLLHKGMYSAYHIERSEDGKNFKRLTDLPYVHMSEALESETAYFVDSLDANQITYHYRINGITPFGETGPYSNTVSGAGKDNLFGFLVIREVKPQDNKNVKLVWEFPVQLEDQIGGFLIGRSSTPNGPFSDISKKILPRDIREFVDITTFNNTYYILKAVDENGLEVSRSFPYLVQFEDNTPPAVPQAIRGVVEKTGVAKIEWQANTDSDLLGYRVFRSNSLNEEFIEVTKEILTSPAFIDTVNIKVLNKQVYYNVVAVDKNYNTSDYSAPLVLDKPDIIPPALPVFIKTEISKDTLYLEWVNSVSDDVAKYELTRMEKNGSIKKMIMTWGPGRLKTNFKETALSSGNNYQYKITAFDSAGNSSEALSKIIFFENGIRQAVSNIKVGADREKKQIDIQWKNGSPAVKCLIYRRKGENALTLYQTLEGNVEAFTDKNVTMNNAYEYKLQLVYDKGIKSMISEGIKIKY